MNDAVTDDARDLNAAQAGDQHAFARLYDRHAPVVLSLCRRVALSEAEDACQETFIRAFRMLDQLEAAAKLRPWLYGIARRVCAERRRATHRRIRHEALAMIHFAAITDPQPAGPGADCAQQEQLDRLTHALDQLDDRQRLAIHLHYLEADPAAAAFPVLNLSRSAYYKLLAKARERLAALLREVHQP